MDGHQRPTERADVVVVGLGTFGAMAAWRLGRVPGLRVVAFERYGRVHAHGAYAGESRLFRAAYHEGARYVPVLLRARELWEELAGVAGRPLLEPVGVLSIAPEGAPELAGVLDSVRRFGLPHETLDTADLAARYPQHRLFGGEAGVLDRLGGALRPELAVSAAIGAAVEGGVSAHLGEPVLGIEDDGTQVTVRTQARTVTARTAIVAAGVWTSKLLPATAPALTVKPLLLTWFLPDRIEDFLPARFPAFLRDHDGVHLFGAPTLDGLGVKVAATDVWGAQGSASEPLPAFAPETLTRLGASVAELLPGLHPEPIRYSVHRDAYTADRAPVIGFAGRTLVVSGFSGHGFKLAPAIGELAAELAAGSSPRLDPTAFASPPLPNRSPLP